MSPITRSQTAKLRSDLAATPEVNDFVSADEEETEVLYWALEVQEIAVARESVATEVLRAVGIADAIFGERAVGDEVAVEQEGDEVLPSALVDQEGDAKGENDVAAASEQEARHAVSVKHGDDVALPSTLADQQNGFKQGNAAIDAAIEQEAVVAVSSDAEDVTILQDQAIMREWTAMLENAVIDDWMLQSMRTRAEEHVKAKQVKEEEEVKDEGHVKREHAKEEKVKLEDLKQEDLKQEDLKQEDLKLEVHVKGGRNVKVKQEDIKQQEEVKAEHVNSEHVDVKPEDLTQGQPDSDDEVRPKHLKRKREEESEDASNGAPVLLAWGCFASGSIRSTR